MLTIRLQRTGTKNSPVFRVVLAEKHRSASKKFLEVLGHYNPRAKTFGLKDEARLKYWLDQNIELSPTVQNLLVTQKFLDKPKVKAWRPKIKEQPKEEEKPAGEAKAATPAEPKVEAKAEPEAKTAPQEEPKAEPEKAEPQTA